MQMWLVLFVLLQESPSGIVFPQEPLTVVPVPTVPAITSLKADEVLVIVSAQPALIIASPDGVVSIEHERGPLKVYCRKPGASQASWSLYDDPAFPHVYLVTPLVSGNVELLCAETLDANSVVRRRLTVAGGGPQPPPVPDPQPKPSPQPQPTPIPKPTPGDLRVLLLIDETDPPSASIAVRSEAVTTWLRQNCVKVNSQPEYRVWDRTTVLADNELDNETAIWRRLFSAVRDQLPDGPVCVVARGTDVSITPFANTAELLAILGVSQ